jgi:predicted RNA-binding Zn-ribbon protein involved in translation (DUF1610 family)
MIYFGVAVIALMVGILIGAGIVGYMHRCNHQWEEIINERSLVAREHYVVFMCKKCGKIKMTGVPYCG